MQCIESVEARRMLAGREMSGIPTLMSTQLWHAIRVRLHQVMASLMRSATSRDVDVLISQMMHRQQHCRSESHLSAKVEVWLHWDNHLRSPASGIGVGLQSWSDGGHGGNGESFRPSTTSMFQAMRIVGSHGLDSIVFWAKQ